MKNCRILQVGRNCWRIRRANKVAFLVDGANYFKALHDSLPLAEQQVLILAWDIYSRLHLVPPENKGKPQTSPTLDNLLSQLLHDKPQLHANILSWDFSLLMALSREWLPIYRLDWSTHRRLKFCLDDQFPLGASHHQKVVVIDDSLAFAGGLDLTRGRWDTSQHQADDPRRQAVDGGSLPIRPYHDMQMAVSGSAAAALGCLARERWRRATSKKLPVPQVGSANYWPEQLSVDIEDVDVAIVRTEPEYGESVGVREVEQLYLDSIAAARDYIYIENQFFTAPSISNALAKRLAEPDGPEVVLNLALNTEGWLSQQSMDMMRVRLISELREADKYSHLAVYYPEKPDLHGLSINLHAKVMIMDDCFVRVGSANLNNRSMGLDTECDLAIEAAIDDSRVQDAIRGLRNRLLGEHLDCEPEEVNAQVLKQDSLIRGIEALRGEGRTLGLLEPRLPETDERTLHDVQLTDPEQPVDSETILNHFVPETQSKSAGRRIISWVLALLALLSIAAVWRFTPLSEWVDINTLTEMANQWRGSNLTPLIVIAAFVIGGLLVMPVTAMIIASVLVFGPWLGFVYALLGSFTSAVSGYGLGALLGRNAVRQVAGKRINQVSRQLAKRGIITMIVVRIVPVAPFTIINLITGASHIRFRDFVLGTLFGMTPGIVGVTLLTDRVEATLRSPDWSTLLTLVMVAAVVFTVGYWLSRQLMTLAKNGNKTSTEESVQQDNSGAS